MSSKHALVKGILAKMEVSAIPSPPPSSSGSVLLILGATRMPDDDGGGGGGGGGGETDRPVAFSVNEQWQLLRLGQSLDYGVCEGTRRDGLRCTIAVNTSCSRHCRYHQPRGVGGNSGGGSVGGGLGAGAFGGTDMRSKAGGASGGGRAAGGGALARAFSKSAASSSHSSASGKPVLPWKAAPPKAAPGGVYVPGVATTAASRGLQQRLAPAVMGVGGAGRNREKHHM